MTNDFFEELRKKATALKEQDEQAYSENNSEKKSFPDSASGLEKGFSSWFRIIIVPLIYLIVFLEVVLIFYFVWAHFQEFSSHDITIIFTAILAQSFLIVKIVTEKLYSNNKTENTSKDNSYIDELVEKIANRLGS